jgi:hypothetical protein
MKHWRRIIYVFLTTITMTEMIIMRYCWCVDRGEKVRTAESFARSDYREVGKRQQEESDGCGERKRRQLSVDPVTWQAGRRLKGNGNATKDGFL